MPYPRPKPPAGGIKAPFPGFIEPELATSVDKVPSGARWIHDVKFDGYRVQDGHNFRSVIQETATKTTRA